MKPEDKIYEAYFKSQKESLYFNELKEISGLSDSSLANTLSKLTQQKILFKNKTKSNTFYIICDKKLFALKFSELALQKFNALNRGVRIPLKNFLENMPKQIYTIIIFGSASRKKEKKGSDIDLLVVSENKFNLEHHKHEGELISNFPLNIFQCGVDNFIENSDDIIIQARKTGFPIYKEQNFYEVQLDEY